LKCEEAESRVSRRDLQRHESGRPARPIFLDDVDRRNFVEILAEGCVKTGWHVHAYVLMPNHFHLVVEMPQPNLVAVIPIRSASSVSGNPKAFIKNRP
jgi:hypothetical protein